MKAQDTVFEVHVCPRPGFQGEFWNGPQYRDRPNVTVCLPSGQWVSAQSPQAVAYLTNAPTNPRAAAASTSSAVNNTAPPPAVPGPTPAATPTQAPTITQTNATQSDSSQSQTAQASVEDNAENEEVLTYIRIGRILIDDVGYEDTIERHYPVVAEFTEVPPKKIEYYRVPAYLVNDSFIGDYENLMDLTGTVYTWTQFQADPLFEKAYINRTLNERVGEIAARLQNGTEFASLHEAPCIPQTPTATKEGKVPPENPMPALKPVQMVRMEENLIGVVVGIADISSHGVELNLDDNIQAYLSHDDSYAAFRRFVAQELTVKDERLTLTEVLNEVDHPGWDVRIYVVSQDAKDDQWLKPMYEWTANSGIVARDFLDKKVWARGGRDLYFQMHIIDRPDPSQKKRKRPMN